MVYAPCDGKVVVIEETTEEEYYKDKRIQVSIFMSPLNVHNQLYPISGNVKYTKYHPGKFLVAWNPKASIDNERSTVVVENDNITELNGSYLKFVEDAAITRIAISCFSFSQYLMVLHYHQFEHTL